MGCRVIFEIPVERGTGTSNGFTGFVNQIGSRVPAAMLQFVDH